MIGVKSGLQPTPAWRAPALSAEDGGPIVGAMQEQPPPGSDEWVKERPDRVRGGTSRRSFIAMCVVGVVAVLFCGAVIFSSLVVRHGRRDHDKHQAINNAKQVGMYLLEFDMEFGSFPGDNTAADVVKATGSTLDFSDGSSNAAFRQLIAYGCDNEGIFHVRHPETATRRPDWRIDGAHALESGEVGFSYVHGLDSSCPVETPVLLTPMNSGSHDRFWATELFKKQAIVLRADNSILMAPVRTSDQKAVDEVGVPVLDVSQSYLGGKWPDIRHPEF